MFKSRGKRGWLEASSLRMGLTDFELHCRVIWAIRCIFMSFCLHRYGSLQYTLPLPGGWRPDCWAQGTKWKKVFSMHMHYYVHSYYFQYRIRAFTCVLHSQPRYTDPHISYCPLLTTLILMFPVVRCWAFGHLGLEQVTRSFLHGCSAFLGLLHQLSLFHLHFCF